MTITAYHCEDCDLETYSQYDAETHDCTEVITHCVGCSAELTLKDEADGSIIDGRCVDCA